MQIPRIPVNIENLYKEETYTDGGMIRLRKLTPVRMDGSPDDARTPIFIAMVSLNTGDEPLPINCMVENVTKLEEAFMCVPDAVEKTLTNLFPPKKNNKYNS